MERLTWAIQRCRDAGMRKTRALEMLLDVMIKEDRPLRLEDLSTQAQLEQQCDRATIYRLLKRLEENHILRRLGLHERAAYYVMSYPDQHGDYLICRDCGSIERLKHVCPVEQLERKLAQETGYADLYSSYESGPLPSPLPSPRLRKRSARLTDLGQETPVTCHSSLSTELHGGDSLDETRTK